MDDANFCTNGEGEKDPRFEILTMAEFCEQHGNATQRERMAELLRDAANCLDRKYLEGAASRMAEAAGWVVGKLAKIQGDDVEGVDFPTHNGGLLVQSTQGGKTALYRHFDGDGALLYVGVSLNAVGRLSEHMAGARWARKIARVDVEWFPCRSLALAAEKHAIQAEKPRHNVVHNR